MNPEEDPNSIAIVVCNKCKSDHANFTGTLERPNRCKCGFNYGHYKVPYEYLT